MVQLRNTSDATASRCPFQLSPPEGRNNHLTRCHWISFLVILINLYHLLSASSINQFFRSGLSCFCALASRTLPDIFDLGGFKSPSLIKVWLNYYRKSNKTVVKQTVEVSPERMKRNKKLKIISSLATDGWTERDKNPKWINRSVSWNIEWFRWNSMINIW